MALPMHDVNAWLPELDEPPEMPTSAAEIWWEELEAPCTVVAASKAIAPSTCTMR